MSNKKKRKSGKKRGRRSGIKDKAENSAQVHSNKDSPSDCEPIEAITPSPLVEEAAPPVPAASSSMPDQPPIKHKEEPQRDCRLLVRWQDPAALVEHEEYHRIPPMPPEQFEMLCADMAARGYLDGWPIHLATDGRTVVDGRSRLRAALRNGIAHVPTMRIEDPDSVDYMYRCALLSRRLTPDQWLALVAEHRAYRSEAAKRKRAEAAAAARHQITLPETDGNQDNISSEDEPVEPKARRDTLKETAEEFGVSQNKLRQMDKLRKDDPQAFEDVKHGKKSAKQAVRDVRHSAVPRKKNKKKAAAKEVKADDDTVAINVPEHWLCGDACQVLRSQPNASVRLLIIERSDGALAEILDAAGAALAERSVVCVFCDWLGDPAVRAALEAASLQLRGRAIWATGTKEDLGKGTEPGGGHESIWFATRGEINFIGEYGKTLRDVLCPLSEHLHLPAIAESVLAEIIRTLTRAQDRVVSVNARGPQAVMAAVSSGRKIAAVCASVGIDYEAGAEHLSRVRVRKPVAPAKKVSEASSGNEEDDATFLAA